MIKQLEITNDDKGWKGTWYRVGERHYAKPDTKEWVAEDWSAVDINGGIDSADSVVVTGLVSFIKCRFVELQILLGFRRCWSDLNNL